MNSHKHVSTTLRDAYKADNSYDELLSLWPQQGTEALVIFGDRDSRGTWLSKRWTERTVVHHIAQGANGADRADVTSNLICLCELIHLWVGRYRADGMALCMRVKIDKGEWDLPEINKVFGLERPGASVAEFIGRRIVEASA